MWADRDDVDFDDALTSATLFAGLDTRLAPVYLGWGTAEGDRTEFYAFIGSPFR